MIPRKYADREGEEQNEFSVIGQRLHLYHRGEEVGGLDFLRGIGGRRHDFARVPRGIALHGSRLRRTGLRHCGHFCRFGRSRRYLRLLWKHRVDRNHQPCAYHREDDAIREGKVRVRAEITPNEAPEQHLKAEEVRTQKRKVQCGPLWCHVCDCHFGHLEVRLEHQHPSERRPGPSPTRSERSGWV